MMYSDTVSIFKALNKDLFLYYILFRCDVGLFVVLFLLLLLFYCFFLSYLTL